MDFHSLTRRALQSLCKKNKIQANMTNVAMADALKALPSVEGVEEFQESQHLLSSKKKAPELKASGRKTTAPPEPQGSPLPRSRRVTARAPQEASKLATSEEEEGKEEEKTAGATTRRRTRRQPTTTTTTKAGDVDVGTRRTTRRRAAIKMAGLRAEEEEEEEEKDVVENVVSNEQSTEEMETKEGEGKQGTNRMVHVEQPKEDQKKEEEEEEEEAEFSYGEIQEVEEEHSVVLNDEEAAKFSNGGIRVVEHTTVLNDKLGVEAAQMNAEISMIDQNRDSEEEEEEEEEAGEEESMMELSVDVPAAATDQTSQVGMVDPSDDGLSPAELVQEDGLGSADSGELAVEFVNGSVEAAHDPTVESENEQSSNGDDADHDGAEDDDDKFAGEESSEAAEMSKTNEEEPDDSYSAIDIPLEMGDFGDELGGGDSAVVLPVEVEDIVPGHLTGELAGEAAASPAKEGSMEENKQSSNGDNRDHAADGGGDGDNDVFFPAEISDENEKADNAKEEETEQYNDIGGELENTNDCGGDSAIEVPVQIEDMGDEDVVVSGLLVGEIAVEAAAAAATTSSPVNIDPVPLSDDADNNNNNKENENADRPEPGRNGVDGLRKAELENLSLRKLRAMYKDTLLLVINKNKGEEKKRSALQALDENCFSMK